MASIGPRRQRGGVTKNEDSLDLRPFGSRIRELRKATGKSYETVAGEASIHRNTLGGIERGAVEPKFATLIKLAKALGVKPSQLLEPFD